MIAIFTFLAGIAPLMARLGSWWLDKTGASEEAQKKFLSDFSAMQAGTDATLAARREALAAVNELEAWQKARDLPASEKAPGNLPG